MINKIDKNGELIEMPIYTEMRPFWNFVSVVRIFRMIRAKFHKHKHSIVRTTESASANKNDNRKISLKSFFRLSPLKMDFNQVNSRGLKRMMRNVVRKVECGETKVERVDVVLIGHSKTFVPYNERTLEPFLKWVERMM